MGILKNAKIKLQAQRQSEEVEASNERKQGLALKDTRDEFSFDKSESTMMIRMSDLSQKDLSRERRNSTREFLNES